VSHSGDDASDAVSAAALKPFLVNCGYTASLVQSRVALSNGQTAALVAFAHPPADARTACVAVVEAKTGSPELVAEFRALAAPVVFVCGRHGLEWWKQTTSEPVRAGQAVPPNRLAPFFAEHSDQFAPDAIYRAKTWGRFDAQHQLSFVDLGLLPVVEERIGRDLEALIVRNVQRLKTLLGWATWSDKQGQWLLKSVFWLVSGKILRDKDVKPFTNLDPTEVQPLLAAVARHYSAAPIPITSQRQQRSLKEVAAGIAQVSNLQFATTESLAYVYENTLISKATRQALGTHSTPSYLVDYIVGRLTPWIAEMPPEQRNVFEPACGHAAFLVSAMRLLTELLPPEKSSPAQRRNYLRKRIHGCDVDAFSLEIARLSLSLTDIPNPDGWDLAAADMFLDDQLVDRARSATVFLANPPFENFSSEERTWYSKRGFAPHYQNKTTETLASVFSALPAGAAIGVVVPQGFLHSKNATAVRQCLVDQFELQEICLFPDSVFTFSDMESAVIVGRKITTGTVGTVRYRRVRERDMDAFRTEYRTRSDLSLDQSRFRADFDLRMPDLQPVWDFCRDLPRLEDFAEVGQGFTFKGKGLPKGTTTFSKQRFPGGVRGFLKFPKRIPLHELPQEAWLNLSADVVLRPRHGTTTGVPQVLFNEARCSRGPWRLKALVDDVGHPAAGRFNIVRARDPERTPLPFLWALCNSPVANAFAFSHSGNRHNDAGMLRKMPVPRLSEQGVRAVCEAAQRYLSVVRSEVAILQSPADAERVLEYLIRMDNEVLKLFAFPQAIEHQLLELFSGWQRQGVPCKFERYFPERFADQLSLADYLAVTADWSCVNRLRGELVHKKVEGRLTAEERRRLEHLQSLAETRRRLEAPLPLAEMEAQYRELTFGASE